MLLMVEKGIRVGICNAIHRYTKANNKYMKNCDKFRFRCKQFIWVGDVSKRTCRQF